MAAKKKKPTRKPKPGYFGTGLLGGAVSASQTHKKRLCIASGGRWVKGECQF